jgi:hypothetical protein
MAYPLSMTAGTHVLRTGADTNLYIWTLAWDIHALLEQPLSIFEANIFFPERRTLAYSENLFGVALMVSPWLALSGNPVLALNMASLLSCVLCGLGAYLLGRHLRLSVPAAIVAGIIFAFAPPRFFRFSQLHLTSVQWIPFCLAYLHQYLDRGRRRHLVTAAAFFTAQALSSGHGALFLMVSAGGLLVYHAVVTPAFRWRTLVRDLGLPGLLVLLVNVPFVAPYFMVRQEAGLERSIRSARRGSPNAVSYVASPTHLHRAILARLGGGVDIGRANALLFPGYLTLALALLALRTGPGNDQPSAQPGDGEHGRTWLRHQRNTISDWVRARRHPALPFYAVLTVLTLWASAGPRLGLYWVLFHVPGFSFTRVPSRLTLMTMLGLAVLAGAGLDSLLRRLPGRRRRLLSGVVTAVLIAEFAAFPLRTRAFAVDIPAVDLWLATQPTPFVVAEVPVRDPTRVRSARLHSTYMLHSMAHWQPTVNGYSGYLTGRAGGLYRRLTRFPDEPSLRALEKLGVNYVVVHLDLYRPVERAALEERLRQWSSRLRLRYAADAGRVYALQSE